MVQLDKVFSPAYMFSVASPIADPGIVSSTPAWPHTFVEIDHEIFSTVIILLPPIQEELLSHCFDAPNLFRKIGIDCLLVTSSARL